MEVTHILYIKIDKHRGFKKATQPRSLVNRRRKRQAVFIGHKNRRFRTLNHYGETGKKTG